MPSAHPRRCGLRALAAVVVLASALHASARAAEPAMRAETISGVEVAQPVALAALEPDCPGLAAQREAFRRRVADPVRAWSQQQLAGGDYRRVLYPFSGPDVVTALSLFPQASHLVMVADQVVERGLLERGDPPTPAQRAQECRTLAFFARLGYFRTKDLMGAGGEKPRFLAMLLQQCAFAGLTVRQVFALEHTGPMQTYRSPRHPAGVRMVAADASGRAVTIDYLTVNLSDAGLAAQPLLIEALRAAASDAAFVKAASHLLQRPQFSTVAGILVGAPRLIVQDETGLDIDRLTAGYDVRAYGSFAGFHPIWAGNASAVRLSQHLASAGVAGPLPFRLGYEKAAGSILLVGQRRGPSPDPTPPRPRGARSAPG